MNRSIRGNSGIILLNPPAEKLYQRDNYNISISKGDYYWPPIDLIFLSGILASEWEVMVLDAVVEGLGVDECKERILRYRPKAIVFLTCQFSQRQDFSFIKKLKGRLSDTKIIASGGFLLVQGDKILQEHPYIDAICKDFTSSDIVAFIKGEYKSVKSLAYRSSGGKIVTFEAESSGEEFEVPVPRHDLFPLERYRFPTTQSKRFTVVKASHGCPNRCAFCAQGSEHSL